MIAALCAATYRSRPSSDMRKRESSWTVRAQRWAISLKEKSGSVRRVRSSATGIAGGREVATAGARVGAGTGAGGWGWRRAWTRVCSHPRDATAGGVRARAVGGSGAGRGSCGAGRDSEKVENRARGAGSRARMCARWRLWPTGLGPWASGWGCLGDLRSWVGGARDLRSRCGREDVGVGWTGWREPTGACRRWPDPPLAREGSLRGRGGVGVGEGWTGWRGRTGACRRWPDPPLAREGSLPRFRSRDGVFGGPWPVPESGPRAYA
jgi:hypothetical protein